VRADPPRRVPFRGADECPLGGPPALPGTPKATAASSAPQPSIHAQLAALARPRKHYHWYYSTREANHDMWHSPQGVHAFLRAYYHHKSADWRQNRPFRLQEWSAEELAKMPTYYIMDLDRNMAETVAPEMPSAAEVAACKWLPDDELAVYSAEYGRNGFQGGLQWYRCRTDPRYSSDLQVFSGCTIDVPSCFIAGRSDWGVYQKPGDFETMQEKACTRMLGCHLVEGAGHWVQQEQSQQVSRLLLEFLRSAHS
jgi:pimeloyl-ACP methyl ester carboxylesterase